jgi:DNA repair protein RecN (Recombination protein N)
MLRELTIKNVAIIENSELSFSSGMTVLTGETGAGKTIIIDALSLLLGSRASVDLIRYGEDKAIVEGVFDELSDKLLQLLDTYEIPHEDGLTITRVVQEGRSTTKVNGVSVTSKELRELSLYLLDIHVQHDTMRLFDEARYLELLDDYAVVDLHAYQTALAAYKTAMHAYDDFIRVESQAQEQLEYWQFQRQELEELGLSAGEELALEEERASLKNYDKVYDLFTRLTSSELDVGPAMYESLSLLQKLAAYEIGKDDLARAESAYYDWSDLIDNIKTKRDQLQYDPDRLDAIETRLQAISRLTRKYKCTADDLLEKLASLTNQIESFDNAAMTKAELSKAVQAAFEPLLLEANRLASVRTAAAAKLATELQKEVAELQLPNVKFAITVLSSKPKDALDAGVFSESGINQVSIDISTNKGEPLKPLAKVASGGEISRVMLGLKSVLLQASGLSTIIFDEIDQGVSGAVAQAMAEKLKRLSKTTQVLLITHLPQVAAQADTHLFVKKMEVNGRTISQTHALSMDERVLEIAAMMSTESTTEKSIALAKELLGV